MLNPSEDIQLLIDRFLRKEASDHEIDELQSWLSQHPSHIRYFKEVNARYQANNLLKDFSKQETQMAWDKLFARLATKNETQAETVTLLPYRVWRAAAAISATLVLSILLWKKVFHNKDLSATDNLVVFNTNNENASLMLPDSSWVWLNANSSIEYAADFKQNREVYLRGEAFFDVRKKQTKNFVVKTEHFSIQVKGTRFNVRAYDPKEQKATLEEGEIELTVKGIDEAYSLHPGDQISINKEERKITLKKVKPTNFSAWKEDKLVFDNASLEEIVAKLENRYQVKISVDSAIAQRERLTMTIEQEPIEDILEMIQLSSMLRYKIENNQITIYE